MAQQDWIEGEPVQTDVVYEWIDGEPLITLDGRGTATTPPWGITPIIMILDD